VLEFRSNGTMLSFTILPRRVRRWEEDEARAGGMTVYRRRPPGLD
jgi:hypothetical protein